MERGKERRKEEREKKRKGEENRKKAKHKVRESRKISLSENELSSPPKKQ